jgi:hypothetical protein
MNYSDYTRECADMQATLEELIPDDINAVVERAKVLAVIMARSGNMLAEAKKSARAKRATEIGNVIVKIAKENCLAAKAQNALVDSIASDELELVDWLDRINAGCVHQIDLCRTIISKEKEEMRMSNFTNLRQ